MRSHEHPILPLFRQAEIKWNSRSSDTTLPIGLQTNVQALFDTTRVEPESLSVRAQELDSSVRLFNRLRRRAELVGAESSTLAALLPENFRLPTFGQLSRSTRHADSFFGMMITRVRRGDYGLESIGNPDTRMTIAILSGYSLAVHRQLSVRKSPVGPRFTNILVSGLSTMMNPESALYRDLFRQAA